MIKYNKDDAVRINHALKVYSYAECIIKNETDDEKLHQLVELAAILHDIGIHVCEEKYNSSAGKYQQIEGPAIAKDILQRHMDDKDIIERIMFLIAHHHTYDNIIGLDYQVLIEADFIVNLFEGNCSRDTIIKKRDELFKTKTAINILNSILLGQS